MATIRIPLEDGELAELIRRSTGKFTVGVSFGPSGAWFEWTEGTPIPPALMEIGKIRGVGTNDIEGEGI